MFQLFLSLLDHLWILSGLVFPLAQETPKMMITLLFEISRLYLETLTICLWFTLQGMQVLYLREDLGLRLHLSFHPHLVVPDLKKKKSHFSKKIIT